MFSTFSAVPDKMLETDPISKILYHKKNKYIVPVLALVLGTLHYYWSGGIGVGTLPSTGKGYQDELNWGLLYIFLVPPLYLLGWMTQQLFSSVVLTLYEGGFIRPKTFLVPDRSSFECAFARAVSTRSRPYVLGIPVPYVLGIPVIVTIVVMILDTTPVWECYFGAECKKHMWSTAFAEWQPDARPEKWLNFIFALSAYLGLQAVAALIGTHYIIRFWVCMGTLLTIGKPATDLKDYEFDVFAGTSEAPTRLKMFSVVFNMYLFVFAAYGVVVVHQRFIVLELPDPSDLWTTPFSWSVISNLIELENLGLTRIVVLMAIIWLFALLAMALFPMWRWKRFIFDQITKDGRELVSCTEEGRRRHLEKRIENLLKIWSCPAFVDGYGFAQRGALLLS